jgi:hypothetical protein
LLVFDRFLGPISHSFNPCHMHTFMLITFFPRLWHGTCTAFTAEDAENAKGGLGNGLPEGLRDCGGGNDCGLRISDPSSPDGLRRGKLRIEPVFVRLRELRRGRRRTASDGNPRGWADKA